VKVFVSWKNSYSVRIPQIDAQHKGLIDLIKQLYAAMQAGKALEATSKTLDELAHYAETHFACEENLMAEHRYSGLAAHRQQHIGFTERVWDLREKFRAGRLTISIETLEFLRNWLADHILNSDRAYARELAG
jgi:hemerythrin-like metal-binding protein